jgi:hypothetical protein
MPGYLLIKSFCAKQFLQNSAANSFGQQKGTHIKTLLGCLPFIKIGDSHA